MLDVETIKSHNRTVEIKLNDPKGAARCIEHFLCSGTFDGVVGFFTIRRGDQLVLEPLIVDPNDDGDRAFLYNVWKVFRDMPKDISQCRILNFNYFIVNAR